MCHSPKTGLDSMFLSCTQCCQSTGIFTMTPLWFYKLQSYCKQGQSLDTPWGFFLTPPCKWRSFGLLVKLEWWGGWICHQCWHAGHNHLWPELWPVRCGPVWSTDHQEFRRLSPNVWQGTGYAETIQTLVF